MIPRKQLRSALALLCLLAFTEVWGQTDSVNEKLDSTVLSARRRTSALILGRAGIEKVDIAGLAAVPSVLGNADPVRFLTNLPGVETGSELDSGIHLQGSENAHTAVMMQGVPVYGAKHMLGLFSAFNPPHFSQMRFSQRAADANRLGGEVDVRLSDKIPEKTGLDISAGIVSVQGTIRQPLGAKTVLSLSGRASLLNLLYRDYVKIDDDPLHYGFNDFNLSLVSRPGSRDVLTVNLYSGSDAGDYTAKDAGLQVTADWRNSLASASWRHDSLEQQIWWSSYWLDANLGFNTMQASVPSGISSAGYKAGWEAGRWRIGAETIWHDATLQHPYVSGGYVDSEGGGAERQTALESSLWAGRDFQITPELSACLTLRGTHFLDPERKSRWGLSPSASLKYNLLSAGRIELVAGAAEQYLFQTGLTNLGFPCEFWFLAGKHSDPQHSIYGILSYGADLDGGMYAVKTDLYYRTLRNQVEYTGDLFDFITSSYDLDEAIIKGSGRNYGLSLMLHKQAGSLTGWIAYNLGRSLRSFDVPGYAGEYPSNHERLHEFNMVATWNGRKWSAGASMVAATGTPFTAPDSFYLMGNRIISHYGAHNSNRLAPYFRTDLSFNWYFIKRPEKTFGANFSVYNATMRQNQLFCKLKIEDGKEFAYRPVHIGFTILPSISIFYRI